MEAEAVRRSAELRGRVKLVRSGGRVLQVYEIGEPVFELAAQRKSLC